MRRLRTIWLLLLLVVCLLSVGGIVAYWSAPVTVQKGHRTVCSDPRHLGDRVLASAVGTVRVPRREAKRCVVTTREITCPVCQARRDEQVQQARIRREREEEAQRTGTWKHLPVLLGKTRNQVTNILGQPDDTFALGFTELIRLHWYYAGKGVAVEPGWNSEYGDNEVLAVTFDSSGNRVMHVGYKIPERARPLVKDLLPREFLSREPDYKAVFVGSNAFRVQFLTRKRSERPVGDAEMVEVTGVTDSAPCIETRVFDANAGVYTTAYSVVLTDWANQKAESYEQGTDRIGIPIGSRYLGNVQGWELAK